jgi:hypothetical protein
VLPISAETSLNIRSTILLSDVSPEEITSSILLKISPVPKKPRKYSIEKRATLFLSLKELILFRGKAK